MPDARPSDLPLEPAASTPTHDHIPDWMGADDFVVESRRASERLVLVPVGTWDLRTRRALPRARTIPAREHRALHVVQDIEEARALTKAWAAELAIPLSFVENDGGIPATIARVVRIEIASGFEEVVVLAARLSFQGTLARLLHDHTAERIGRAVTPIPDVLAGLVAVTAHS
jgi:hypothetical protein